MPGTYYMPRVNLIHRGALKDVGIWAHNIGGTKGLVVASMGSYGENQGKMVSDVLAKDGIQSVVYAGAGPNPTDSMVMNGVELYKDQTCDFLVASWRGKCRGLRQGNRPHREQRRNDRTKYEGVGKATQRLAPFITVNTTAGTGSEVTSVAVLTESKTHHKMTIVDWRLTADVSVNDPELMLSMPPSLTAATGMDALSHAIEAYVCTIATALTDSLAYEAITLVYRWLPVAFEHGDDIAAREGMCHAAFLAGLAFNNSGLGYVHALSHPLTGKYGAAAWRPQCHPDALCHAVEFRPGRNEDGPDRRRHGRWTSLADGS